MVTFLDLITFFGLASFFGWLAYVPLHREMLEGLKLKEEEFNTLLDNLVAINDYFLVSFLFYSGAIVADYLVHADKLPLVRVNPLFGSIFLDFTIAGCFFAGLVTLGAAVLYERSVWTGVDLTKLALPRFGYTLVVSILVTIDIIILTSVVFTLTSASPIPTISSTIIVATWIMICMIPLGLGALSTMTLEKIPNFHAFGFIMLVIPIIARIVIALVFHF